MTRRRARGGQPAVPAAGSARSQAINLRCKRLLGFWQVPGARRKAFELSYTGRDTILIRLW